MCCCSLIKFTRGLGGIQWALLHATPHRAVVTSVCCKRSDQCPPSCLFRLQAVSFGHRQLSTAAHSLHVGLVGMGRRTDGPSRRHIADLRDNGTEAWMSHGTALFVWWLLVVICPSRVHTQPISCFCGQEERHQSFGFFYRLHACDHATRLNNNHAITHWDSWESVSWPLPLLSPCCLMTQPGCGESRRFVGRREDKASQPASSSTVCTSRPTPVTKCTACVSTWDSTVSPRTTEPGIHRPPPLILPAGTPCRAVLLQLHAGWACRKAPLWQGEPVCIYSIRYVYTYICRHRIADIVIQRQTIVNVHHVSIGFARSAGGVW